MADQAGSGAARTLLWVLLIGALLGAATTWVANRWFGVTAKAGVLFVGAALLVVSTMAYLFGLVGRRTGDESDGEALRDEKRF